MISKEQQIKLLSYKKEKDFEIERLSTLVPNKQTLYEILSTIFVLSKINTHACSLEYLNKYTLDPIPIYSCEIQGTKIYSLRYKRGNAPELLDSLDRFLQQKNKPRPV